MDMPGRTPGKPVADGLRLAGRFAAHHDVNLETGRKVGLDGIQESAERGAATAPVALSDDRAGGNVESCDPRGRAGARVVMSTRST